MDTHAFLIIAILFFMFCSAFFSATETALFSLDEIKIRSFSSSQAKQIRKLLQRSSDVLVTLLTVNTITNIILTTLISAFLGIVGIEMPFLLASMIVASIIIIFGEILPKTFATVFTLDLVPLTLKPVRILVILFSFLTRPIHKISLAVTEYFQHHLPEEDTKEDRRTALYNVVVRGKFLKDEEKLLIGRVLSLAERHVTEIMTPRPRVFSVNITESLSDIKTELLSEQHSRIPVHQDQDSQVVGVMSIEDIILAQRDPEKHNLTAGDLMQPFYYIPESKTLAGILEDFRKRHIEIAAVVDEYGDFLGVITLSDILGELVGAVADEDFEDDITQLMPNRYVVRGETTLIDFNQTFHTRLESQEYETIAGYLIEEEGGIPPLYSSFEIENLVITVRERTSTRVESLSVRVK
ncbi:MAG: hemolysin family protein [Brevinema sp.]